MADLNFVFKTFRMGALRVLGRIIKVRCSP